MNKQFNRFSAIVPIDFNEKMIEFWMRYEGLSLDEAINTCNDDSFIGLANRIKGERCNFKPDLGYSDKDINGSLCFEIEDNNFCIPVSILN